MKNNDVKMKQKWPMVLKTMVFMWNIAYFKGEIKTT